MLCKHAKFEVPILKRNGEKGTWSFDPFLGGAKRGKKDKNWPFHPRKFRLPRIPRGVLHRFSFSPSVVGASLFDIHALVYSLPPYSPLTIPLIIYKISTFLYILDFQFVFMSLVMGEKRGFVFSDLKIFIFKIWKGHFPISPKNDFFQNWPFHFWKVKMYRGQ